MTDILHIPDGINYECTGCGKCCSGWIVPMTASDYKRINKWNWSDFLPEYKGWEFFRPLKDYEKAGTPYTHSIKAADNGYCPFLVDNLCFIHKEFGAEVKPSMCQLFPYCFNETPSGIYATVSFVSNGVLMNHGKALALQKEYLEKKLHEFRKLYPNHHPNWSKLQLAVGQPMLWDEYLKHEQKLIAFLKDKSMSIEKRMLAGSQYIAMQLKTQTKTSSPLSDQVKQDQSPDIQLNKLDRHLLYALHKMYFPTKELKQGESHFNNMRFLFQFIYERPKIKLVGRSFDFKELHAFPWPYDDKEIEDLIYRYFYSRVFGKLYFGAGFGQISLSAGFNHLILILALIKLQSKALAIARDSKQVTIVEVMDCVRELEKRLGESKLGAYEAGLWELLMQNPKRSSRVLAAT